MLKLGIVNFDTSDVEQFTKRLKRIDMPEDQWVDGADIVAGCPGTSLVSPERVPGYTESLRNMGVEIVDRPEDLIGKVDGVLIEANDGGVHLELAKPFIEAGLSLYIDKPFASSLADAKELVRLAEAKGVSLFSSSSLRYGTEVQDVLARHEEIGRVIGADAYSPASTHERNPGLYHYGVHGVETLYALMGPGCKSLTCTCVEGGEVVTGLWEDGRLGTMRGTRAGAHSYGFTVWGEKRVESHAIGTGVIYRELLRRIVQFFETGEAPLCIHTTVEIMAFMEAALKSAAADGARVALGV